jgi:acyl dehydratase
MEAKDIPFEDIVVGDTASFERTLTADNITAFATLSGDSNPLHVSEEYAKTTQFGKPLVYGMLLAGLFSTLVGMHLPGKRCLYLGQTLQFKKPVFAGDTVQVTGTVVTKSDSTRLLTINTVITKCTEEVVTGVATVQVLN